MEFFTTLCDSGIEFFFKSSMILKSTKRSHMYVHAYMCERFKQENKEH